MKKIVAMMVTGLVVLASSGEIQVIDGVKYECKNGMCMIVDDEEEGADAGGEREPMQPAALQQGYMEAEAFVNFLKGDEPTSMWLETDFAKLSAWELLLSLLFVLLGGFLMNLTPCVLPMIPINLMVIGKSAARGAWYALGIATAYGALGVLSAVGGLAFGTIQGSPYFNLTVACVFVALALALVDVYFIDLSRFRPTLGPKPSSAGGGFAFFMGILSAVLAGACVAPILISVLLLTAKLYAEGHVLSLALPFVMGLGMALPWPFLGAGMKVLPRPGAWMKGVNRAFALLVLGFAAWYGRLAWVGFMGAPAEGDGTALRATPETLPDLLSTLRAEAASFGAAKPILVDCWATWCKNCAAMEKVMAEPAVAAELERFTVIRLQAEDIRALRALPGFADVKGLPAFAIFLAEE